MIPLSVPNLNGNELKYVKECIDTNWISSVGSYVNRFEDMAASFSGVKKAIATSNGTSALHICLLLAGVERGDLVILPNITFVAPANVVKYVGADPIFIDIYPDTWQLDVDLLEEFLDEQCYLENERCYHKSSMRRIAAIIPVHVLGNMVNMTSLLRLAEKYKLTVVEDATEALGSTYDGKPAGSLGKFGCLSYNGNKIISTGGGGMILTNDEELAARCKHLTTQAKADPYEYYHDEVGYNYRLVNILAAMGVAQMEQLPSFISRKKGITAIYNGALKGLPGFLGQTTTERVDSNCWLYTAAFASSKELQKHLIDSDIQVRPFWIPMNRLPAFANDIYYHVTDNSHIVKDRCLSLPCSTSITDLEIEHVINKIKEFYG